MSLLRLVRCASVAFIATLLVQVAHAVPVLDFSGWRPADGPRALDGEWEFVASRLLSPSDPWPADAVRVRVPHEWRSNAGPRRGFGTYRVRVVCGNAQPLALALPFQHSAASVFVNGALVAEQGRPGATRAQAQPSVRQQILALPASPCPMDVLVQVSNFDMYRGGFVRSVLLGTPAQLAQRHEDIVLRAQMAQGALFFAGTFGLAFFLWRRRDRGPLLFALFSLSCAVTLSLGGERANGSLADMVSFDAFMRLVYLNWFLALGTFPWVLEQLYPQESWRRFVWAITGVGAAGALFSLGTPAHVLTWSTPVLAAASIAVGLYGSIVLGRALLRKRHGAAILLAAMAMFAVAVLNDLLMMQRVVGTALMPFGILGFVAAPAVLLAQRFARALTSEELRVLEQRGRADLLVRATQAGVLDWNAVAGTTEHSARYLDMLGYTAGEPPPFFELVHPQDRERVRASFTAQLRDRSVRSDVRRGEPADYRMVRADGAVIWVHAEAIAICGADGRTLRYICTFIDITHLKDTERALAQSLEQIAAQAKQLEAQNETLQENIRLREEVERIGRHDIKTPLNTIVAVPRLLREERKLGAEADELLGIVERAGYRILSMVNLSLDLYKMEQGTYVFRPDAVDLTELAGKVIADLRTQAQSKGVTVRQAVGRVPYAWAEELLCYSLLANLLKNAIEASPEDAEVRVTPQVQDGDVLLRIHNLGAVPESIRANFFGKYTSLGKASGTGLGTYSARLMARVQDGDVTMSTSAQEGTTLTVRLRAAPEGALPVTTRHIADRRGIDPGALASLPPTRVLLVDDDEYNLLIVRRFLPSPPFTVETAINGRAALEAARRHWPGLVFMDLDMPVMGGVAAVREFRREQREGARGACTMVALSSHDDEPTRREALAAGFDRYLTKPVTRDAIQETLLALRTGRRKAPPMAHEAPVPPAVHAPALDPEVLALIPEFLASRHPLLASLARAIEAADRGEVRRLAHQLAGSFALYGFAGCGATARWMEQHAASATLGELEAAATALARRMREEAAQLCGGIIPDVPVHGGSGEQA